MSGHSLHPGLGIPSRLSIGEVRLSPKSNVFIKVHVCTCEDNKRPYGWMPREKKKEQKKKASVCDQNEHNIKACTSCSSSFIVLAPSMRDVCVCVFTVLFNFHVCVCVRVHRGDAFCSPFLSLFLCEYLFFLSCNHFFCCELASYNTVWTLSLLSHCHFLRRFFLLIVCAIVDQQEDDRSFWTLATSLIKDGNLSFNGPKLQSQQRCTDGGWVGWGKVGGLTTYAYYECIFVYHLSFIAFICIAMAATNFFRRSIRDFTGQRRTSTSIHPDNTPYCSRVVVVVPLVIRCQWYLANMIFCTDV